MDEVNTSCEQSLKIPGWTKPVQGYKILSYTGVDEDGDDSLTARAVLRYQELRNRTREASTGSVGSALVRRGSFGVGARRSLPIQRLMLNEIPQKLED